MGTRSLVRFYTRVNKTNNKRPLVVFYQQYDGYPSEVGMRLAEFLKNNYYPDINCLSATYCSEFKTGSGGFYIYDVDSGDEEWNYDVIVGDQEARVVVREWGSCDSREMDLDEFYEFCEANGSVSDECVSDGA